MNILKADFVLTTPAFLGDADQKASKIRPPSVKGALRFWWRALNWSGFFKQANQNEVAALKTMRKEEARLFGTAAAEDNAGGQGVFLLSIAKDETKLAENPFATNQPEISYLLGQGLKKRNALDEKGAFTVQLLFRPKTSASDQESVANALYAFGLLGALGSRARHGMGSLSLTGWEGGESRTIPKTEDEYKKAIQTLLGPEAEQAAALPPFTAFSHKSEIWISVKNKSPIRLLSIVGEQQMFYRSYGINKKVLGKDAEQNFKDDHHLIRRATNHFPINEAPKRVIFGLPHNYRFSDEKTASVNYVQKHKDTKEEKDARRASPLILHIHQLAGDQFLAIHILLPAVFLPEKSSIRVIAEGRRQNIFLASSSISNGVFLTNYLARFTKNPQDKIYG